MSTAAPFSTATDHAPAAASVAPAMRCENCGAAVTGRYCSACGQRLEPPVHSLWHFTQLAIEDLTHADSRLWRTLAPLLFKPGYLTAEFLAGRRARYLPPLRLYLVLSVVFFLWATTTEPKLIALRIDTDRGVSSTVALTQDEAALLAAAMMLMYWRPRHYYVEHLLLFVHNHAFVFLLLLLAWAGSALLPVAAPWVRFAVGLYIPWYLYRSMRVAYGQGRWLTCGKLLLLGFFYLVSGTLMLALTTAYSALTL